MDILSLHRQGLSANAIAAALGLNWRTVKKYIQNRGQQRSYDSSKRRSRLAPYHERLEQWLQEDNYTATRLFDRLKAAGYTGSYQTVKRKVREIKGRLGRKAYVRFETEPGRQAQVDFADFQIDDGHGSVKTVFVFSMVLGFSRKKYMELVAERSLATFLDCHIRAFEAFGGVPGEVLYDRMKNVLIRQMLGKLEWNRDFYSFCLHYQFRPLVAPPYAAWVKGKVERPFRHLREDFWRGYEFRDLDSANRDLTDWLLLQETRLHGTTRERIDERFARELPHLGPLPESQFDTSPRCSRRVHKDCTVSFLGNRYVMPHRTVGRTVTLRPKNGLLRAFLNDELLVCYSIPEGKGNLVHDGRFYAALREDAEQIARKYPRFRGRKQKGRARSTLGITTKSVDSVIVSVRPVAEYQRFAEAGR